MSPCSYETLVFRCCGQRGPGLHPAQPTALLHSTWDLPDPQTCLSACPPHQWCCQERCHRWVTCCRVPFILFSPSSLSLCLHGCSWGHVPSSLGATEPPQSFLHQTGGCLPFCVAFSSSFPRLHPSEAAELGHCHGTFLVSGVPSPRASSCPLSQSPASLHTSCTCHSTGECLESSL